MQMETWEFLLQREEDNTWLPLESSDVEILEGRYRIVARSGQASTEMEVRITHHAYEETPPIRRVQTRKTKTTPEGLMVVIPYTRLKPGTWDLACSPSGQSDDFGLSCQQSIKLRVLPQEAEIGESSTANLPSDDETESTLPESDDGTETVEAVSPIENEAELSAETVTSDMTSATHEYDWVKWDAFADTTSVQPPPPPLDTETSETIDPTELPLLQLILDQTAYVAKLGEGFLVSGQVQQLEETEATITTLTEPYLQVSLRDPQTGDILTETQQPVPATELPIVFSAIIYLPFECKTRLILAEISLYDQTIAVARQTFTVTTQVEHLLQAIEEDFSEIDELEAMAEDLPNNSAFYLSLPLEPESEQPLTLDSQSLPPLISQPTSAKLELPGFGNFISDNNPTEATPEETVTAATNTTEIPETVEETQIQPIEDIKPLSPVEQEFKHLNIQDRFLTRLNSLATDQDLSQWMRNTTPKPLPETPLLPGTIQPTSAKDSRDSQDLTLDAFASSISEDLESQEIVIDDEPIDESPALYPRRPTTPRLQLVPAREEQPVSLPESFLGDQPLPAPTLEVMADELVAGRSVQVRVRLPQDLPRVYTKIWVYDRQARNIIDGPRWLTEFAPNGLEEIETLVNLDIAYGSLEVQIEAIAVEMQTQRESPKVSLERTVMPPSEPSLP
jgi:hypothetical protein